ncbi:MAG TPA: hypothetical protein DCY13_21945 [Verrucomicrobiales bacterium]|nr:hypothetical protein [Verrucomicrobiales bacterium]
MSNVRPPHAPVPRSLVLAMLLQFGIGGAVLPFITLLFLDRGLTFTQVSHIFAVSSAALLVSPFFWGMLADRFVPLNRLYTWLNLLIFILLGVVSLQHSFAALLVSFMAFYACFNPSLVLLNPLSFFHLENPRSQFGRLRAWGSLGWILPSGFVYGWMQLRGDMNLTITIHCGMAMAAAMIVVSRFLTHIPPGAAHVTPDMPSGTGYLAAVKRLLRNPAYLTALAVYFLVASSFAVQAVFSAPLLEEAGLARRWIGPSQCIGVMLEIMLFRSQARLLGRLSISSTILIGVVAMILRHLVFWQSDNLWLLVGSHLLTGMVIVYHHIGVSVLVNAIAPKEVRSTAQTLLILFGSGIGPMLANGVVGWITAASGQNLRMVFAFSTALAVAGGTLLVIRSRRLNASVNPAA